MKEVEEQIKFYFSNTNLAKDKYLQQKLRENNGYINLNELFNFSSLKSIIEVQLGRVANVSSFTKEELDELLKNINEDNENKLKLNENFDAIKREVEFQFNSDEFLEQTIYIEPIDEDSTFETIKEKYFSEYTSKIQYISIPKFSNKLVKGFAFVEFNEQNDQTHFLNQDFSTHPTLSKLIIISKKEWLELKDQYSYLNIKNYSKIIKVVGLPNQLKKPQIWKLLDQSGIKVCFLDYVDGTTKNPNGEAIFKFKNDIDLQNAIELIYKGKIIISEKPISISPMSETEIQKYKEKLVKYHTNKQKPYYNNNYNQK